MRGVQMADNNSHIFSPHFLFLLIAYSSTLLQLSPIVRSLIRLPQGSTSAVHF